MLRLNGHIYKTTDKYIILILDNNSKNKISAKSSFFKIDITKCRTEDEILLKHGYIGNVSVLVDSRKYKFGNIEGVRYIAVSMQRQNPF